MKLFDAYFPYNDTTYKKIPVLVDQSFPWLVVFFGSLGIIMRGYWISGLLLAAIALLLHGFFAHIGWHEMTIVVVSHLLMAFYYPLICRWELTIRGYKSAGQVVGHTKDDAIIRIMEQKAASFSGKTV